MEVEHFSWSTNGQKIRTEDFDFDRLGLQDVCYTYPGDDPEKRGAVKNLSMEIKKGEKYIIRKGEKLPLSKEWSSLFAYVPQGNHLMSGKIRDVVAFSNPEKSGSDEEIYHALEIACARKFVEALPQGLDTMLGERGAGLSEGQMQRLAVARALFSDRPVLLLDEATSALDGESEVTLLENIRSLTGKTVIIVTHRPAALEVVDQVISFAEE